ncbi:neuroblastoma-amplified sequence, partial [Ixodes scapularis]
STKEKFVLCVRDWLLPFVDRCEKAAPGSRRKLLSEFFTEVARDDLGPCVDIFEHSSPDDPVCILNGPLELAELALACICSCQRDDQLGHVVRILKCVPQRGVG